MRKEKSFPSIGARARVAGEPTRLLDPRRNRTVNARRIRSLLPSVGAIANDPRFPPKAAAIDGNAIRDWTHRIWFHGRCTAPSYSCVEIVKISRGYPPLNWIAATCALPTTRTTVSSPPFRFGLLPRAFLLPSGCARTCALFFHVFFSLVRFFARDDDDGGASNALISLRKAISVIPRTDFTNGWFRFSKKEGDMCFRLFLSLSLSRSNYSNGFVSRLDNHGTGYSAFFKSVGRFQSWLARVSFEICKFVRLSGAGEAIER